ncbi:MAG: BREX system ATP-binding domain-containing protein, partial [Paracoccaceae bacterium]
MTSLPAVGPSPPTREPLRLRLLGPPGVAMGDTALTIPRRQVRALLYYLAAAGEPVPRERLAFLFWPDTPETDARRSLTRLLTHLRRALPREDLLQTEDDCVGLDPDGVVVDLVVFERLAEREDDVAALRRAADLYRGAFLDGFSLPGSPEYEGWLVTQQRACEVCYLGVLSALIDACGASGDHDAAIAAARRYLATDELAEDVHRRLIALYAAAGDRAAALGQFERCAAVLERELGVRPLPETRAAYESVLQSRPLPPACSPRELAWTTLPSLSVPLVGRETAMRVLQAALADAEAGRGCVVLVSGEPGIGKSRLLEAFATRARDRALVLAAAARSVERALPYQPVADAIRTLSSWEPLDTLPPVWLAEASRVLPDLRDLRPGLPAPLPVAPQEARTRLLEALSHLLLRLAEGPKPLLLCLDDLQWADSATLDWLVHLAPRLADRRVLIVAAYRSEEQTRVEGLRRALSRLGQRRELHLAGLGVEDVAQIVRRAVGR